MKILSIQIYITIEKLLVYAQKLLDLKALDLIFYRNINSI